jgi:hypothetical protein
VVSLVLVDSFEQALIRPHSFVELGVPAVQLARAWPPNIPDERVWPGWARVSSTWN